MTFSVKAKAKAPVENGISAGRVGLCLITKKSPGICRRLFLEILCFFTVSRRQSLYGRR